MVERVRSLEETRAKQIAQTSAGIFQHRPALQRHPARGDLLGRGHPEIDRLYPRLRRRRQELHILRASLTVDLPWIRSMSVVGKNGRVQCSTLNGLSASISATGPTSRKCSETRDFVFSRLSVRPGHEGADHHRRLSGSRGRSGRRRLHHRHRQPRLDVEDDEQSRRQAGHFGRARRQHRHRAGRAARSGQHDRPSLDICRCWRPSPARRLLRTAKGSVSFTAADGTPRLVTFARIPGTQSRLIVSIDEAKVSASDQSRHQDRLFAAGPSSACSC